jgi:hypothetical protein
MTLARPTAPELARFTFFVSRRREEGRERFRLHMGYFQTRDEAEQLLALIRDLYPAAWVGDAPGKRLAARDGAGGAPAAAPAAERRSPAPTRATAAVKAPPAPAAKPAPAPAAAAAAAAPAAPVRATPSTRVPPSNVREVIASLDGQSSPPAAASRPAASPPRAAEPPVRRQPAAKPAAGSPAQARAPAAAPPARPARGADELSDSQVLRILETRRASAAGQPAPGARAMPSDIRMLNPDDTQTWQDIRSQISRDAAVHFAVQLAWSVTPIDLDRIPGLAIFNSYTLYKIEGNREGRRWYGLRLGFFSDAVSARQVALYVRSEFASVAVVPVSGKERGDAMQVGAIDLPRAPVATPVRRTEDEIELIDDAVDAALAAADPVAAKPAPQPGPAASAAPAAPAGGARRPSRPRGSPQTLEETLEILGASQLSIDDGKGVRLDIGSSTGGGRRAGPAAPRNTTFSKLLDRLTEKLRS